MLEMDFITNYVDEYYETEMDFCELGGLVNDAKEEFSLFMALDDIVGFTISYQDTKSIMKDLSYSIRNLSEQEITDEVISLVTDYHVEVM
jgi:hypothetical protein